MSGEKLSAGLRARLAEAIGAEPVEVMLELGPIPPPSAASREERIVASREAFRREAEPVAEAVRSAGGTVLGDAWVTQTVLARIPAPAVTSLGSLEQVVRIDLPASLTLNRG